MRPADPDLLWVYAVPERGPHAGAVLPWGERGMLDPALFPDLFTAGKEQRTGGAPLSHPGPSRPSAQ